MHSVRICKWLAFAAAFMAVVDFILGMIIFMPRSDYRTMNGTVCGRNLVMTEDGNVWEYETEMPIYAHVAVTLDGNFTSDVKDDAIVIVK